MCKFSAPFWGGHQDAAVMFLGLACACRRAPALGMSWIGSRCFMWVFSTGSSWSLRQPGLSLRFVGYFCESPVKVGGVKRGGCCCPWSGGPGWGPGCGTGSLGVPQDQGLGDRCDCLSSSCAEHRESLLSVKVSICQCTWMGQWLFFMGVYRTSTSTGGAHTDPFLLWFAAERVVGALWRLFLPCETGRSYIGSLSESSEEQILGHCYQGQMGFLTSKHPAA